MTNEWPTVNEVAAWLRDRDQLAMAVVVERMQATLAETQAANQRNYDAWKALQEKHEPQPRREHAPTWTGD
jgi:hypothetical protein